MNLNKFTEKSQEAIVAAQTLATDANHAEVTPEHLLVALVEQQGGIVPSILRKMNLDPSRVAADARALLDAVPKAYGADVRLSPRMKLIFDSAQAEAVRHGAAHLLEKPINLRELRTFVQALRPEIAPA